MPGNERVALTALHVALKLILLPPVTVLLWFCVIMLLTTRISHQSTTLVKLCCEKAALPSHRQSVVWPNIVTRMVAACSWLPYWSLHTCNDIITNWVLVCCCLTPRPDQLKRFSTTKFQWFYIGDCDGIKLLKSDMKTFLMLLGLLIQCEYVSLECVL